ncbi:MAG: hypothetical protein Sv326_0454 [Candidatus Fermentimicrarchaeum limneticum]|uniref:Uncharacterized protein n=1 Tax=Fermentimicrarchaeum limneticum TaxID=2795018 RepID=A0A7D6BGJ3_FERL1|nr:MAG: hypothetical protein Sv326_0380 [Candidatus Fermentimicrarchaeum limneticum]QLJ52592.1 MAG: hypothetical protein Sv326_0417 [Candidatus Fermentimicrarchaeum limneticum]QLJ52629.1 MAG: hypothetical protein Sv326_0454 [Candidatus Fermentimicrarchaeum limneticum]
MNFPKIDNRFWFAIPISFSVLCAFFTISVFNSYAQKVDQRFASQNSRIGELDKFNDTYKQQVNSYLAYLATAQNTLSQQVNLTSEDSLQRINSLKEQDKNLQNQLDALNKTLLDINCTGTNTTIIYNNTVQVPVQNTTIDSRTCRQKLLDLHGLGPYFDVVACCELRQVGYADECCTCYR